MTAEIIPFHNFTVEKANVQAKTINQNVENMTQNITKQVNHYGKKSYGKVPRLLPEHGGLTDSHRATIDKLIAKQVLLESFAFGKSNFGKVSKNLIKDVGSSSINRMMDIDFPRAESVLKQNIARLNNHYLVRQKRTGLLALAHNRIKELGVGEDTRREYQFLRYGKKSMADFEADDLADYCQYLSQPYPAFDINETFIEPEQAARKQSPKLNTQQKREVILGEWLKAKEYNDKTFDRWAMDYSTDDFYRILKTLGKTFALADDTLRKFMDSQKICKLKVGSKTTV